MQDAQDRLAGCNWDSMLLEWLTAAAASLQLLLLHGLLLAVVLLLLIEVLLLLCRCADDKRLSVLAGLYSGALLGLLLFLQGGFK